MKTEFNALTDYKIDIRFADIDAMGHVNNAVYFTYFEQARMNFFAQALKRKWNWDIFGIIVAHNEIDYYKPIVLHDEAVIRVSVSAIGTKSFTLSYHIYRGEELCSKGASVLVCFNHKTQSTQQIPAEWQELLSALMNNQAGS